MPRLLKPGQADFEMPSLEAQALEQISKNQVAIANLLKQIINQSEIQIRIMCGADPKSLWKMRFLKADKEQLIAQQAEEAAHAGEEEADEEYDDYPQEYQSLQEREDPDREAKRRGGYPPETAAGEEGVPE